MFAAFVEAEGCSPVDAAVFALGIRRRIKNAMRAIEVSGRGVGAGG
jgi:hypothetical protein